MCLSSFPISLLSHPSNFYHPLNFLNLPHIRSCFYIRTASFTNPPPPRASLTNTPHFHFTTPSTSHWNPSHPPETLPSMCSIYFRFLSSSCCRIFIFMWFLGAFPVDESREDFVSAAFENLSHLTSCTWSDFKRCLSCEILYTHSGLCDDCRPLVFGAM
jgi:hypothetical protein